MASKSCVAGDVELEEHLDGRGQSVVFLELLLGVEDTHICRNTIESADMDNGYLCLFGLLVVFQSHTLKELGLSCDVDVRRSFLDTS